MMARLALSQTKVVYDDLEMTTTEQIASKVYDISNDYI